MELTHASLFSGLGGFDLAAEWAGWTNAFNCEIDNFCTQVLKFHFPNATHYDNIKDTDFTQWRGKVDVLTGGFPCQPFSLAGQRKGTTDDRYLWPEMLRAIREIQPSWVIGENVVGILTMVQPGEEVKLASQYDLFGENHRERVICREEFVVETVCRDLEREGYTVQPFVIPACSVGAPHRRDRVWFVTNRDCFGCRERENKQEPFKRSEGTSNNSAYGKNEIITSAEPIRCKKIFQDVQSEVSNGKCINSNGMQWDDTLQERSFKTERWKYFPTVSPVCRRNDGLPFDVDNLTIPFTKWRQESVKAYGNAIVPQVAYEIFKAINETYYKQ